MAQMRWRVEVSEDTVVVLGAGVLTPLSMFNCLVSSATFVSNSFIWDCNSSAVRAEVGCAATLAEKTRMPATPILARMRVYMVSLLYWYLISIDERGRPFLSLLPETSLLQDFNARERTFQEILKHGAAACREESEFLLRDSRRTNGRNGVAPANDYVRSASMRFGNERCD